MRYVLALCAGLALIATGCGLGDSAGPPKTPAQMEHDLAACLQQHGSGDVTRSQGQYLTYFTDGEVSFSVQMLTPKELGALHGTGPIGTRNQPVITWTASGHKADLALNACRSAVAGP